MRGAGAADGAERQPGPSHRGRRCPCDSGISGRGRRLAGKLAGNVHPAKRRPFTGNFRTGLCASRKVARRCSSKCSLRDARLRERSLLLPSWIGKWISGLVRSSWRRERYTLFNPQTARRSRRCARPDFPEPVFLRELFHRLAGSISPGRLLASHSRFAAGNGLGGMQCPGATRMGHPGADGRKHRAAQNDRGDPERDLHGTRQTRAGLASKLISRVCETRGRFPTRCWRDRRYRSRRRNRPACGGGTGSKGARTSDSVASQSCVDRRAALKTQRPRTRGIRENPNESAEGRGDVPENPKNKATAGGPTRSSRSRRQRPAPENCRRPRPLLRLSSRGRKA